MGRDGVACDCCCLPVDAFFRSCAPLDMADCSSGLHGGYKSLEFKDTLFGCGWLGGESQIVQMRKRQPSRADKSSPASDVDDWPDMWKSVF